MQFIKRSYLLIYISLILAILCTPYIFQQIKFNVDYSKLKSQVKFTSYSPVGNLLVAYFYYIGSKPDPKVLEFHKIFITPDLIPELKNFYGKLDWNVRVGNVPMEFPPNEVWNQWRGDGQRETNYLQFWQTLRPYMQDFFAKVLPPMHVTMPVLHFRCSDSPFNKHYQYHMPKAKSVVWMAKQIKARGYDEVLLLSCNQHQSLDQNSCQKFIEFYTNIFNSAGIKVQTSCNDILHDLAIMVHSPVLVSMNASSFSFIAGVAKPPQNYISCNMGMEVNGKYILQTDADWVLDPRAPLLHADIADYNDWQTVIKKLQ